MSPAAHTMSMLDEGEGRSDFVRIGPRRKLPRLTFRWVCRFCGTPFYWVRAGNAYIAPDALQKVLDATPCRPVGRAATPEEKPR